MRRILLDTHVLLWYLENLPQLSTAQLAAVLNPQTEVLVSEVSLFEISIKVAIGKLRLQTSLPNILRETFAPARFTRLSITDGHLIRYAALPFPANGHRDPFDRMLIAQALTEDAALVSDDDKFGAYAALALLR